VEAAFIKKPPFTTVVKPVYVVKPGDAILTNGIFTKYGTFTTVVKAAITVKILDCQIEARSHVVHAG
jgi:hypothetical protein